MLGPVICAGNVIPVFQKLWAWVCGMDQCDWRAAPCGGWSPPTPRPHSGRGSSVQGCSGKPEATPRCVCFQQVNLGTWTYLCGVSWDEGFLEDSVIGLNGLQILLHNRLGILPSTPGVPGQRPDRYSKGGTQCGWTCSKVKSCPVSGAHSLLGHMLARWAPWRISDLSRSLKFSFLCKSLMF